MNSSTQGDPICAILLYLRLHHMCAVLTVSVYATGRLTQHKRRKIMYCFSWKIHIMYIESCNLVMCYKIFLGSQGHCFYNLWSFTFGKVLMQLLSATHSTFSQMLLLVAGLTYRSTRSQMCWGVVVGTSGVGTFLPVVSRNWKLILVGESVYRSGLRLSPECPEITGLPSPVLFSDFFVRHLHTNTATSTTVRISTIAANTPISQLSFSSEKEIMQQFSLFKYKIC